jgi:hypothetical protein
MCSRGRRPPPRRQEHHEIQHEIEGKSRRYVSGRTTDLECRGNSRSPVISMY